VPPVAATEPPVLLLPPATAATAAAAAAAAAAAVAPEPPVLRLLVPPAKGQQQAFMDDVEVVRVAVREGGEGGSRGFAVSRDLFRDHKRKRWQQCGFTRKSGREDCQVPCSH
jgi:hypothetical protein